MSTQPIKVFLVEDSPVTLRILERIIEASTELELVGTARNGKEAREKIANVQPQVICTDLWMAHIDGAELIKWAMAHHPCPILVISEDGHKPEVIDRLKRLGALDVIRKPRPPATKIQDWEGPQLIQSIKIISGVTVFTKPLRLAEAPDSKPNEPKPSTNSLNLRARAISRTAPVIDIVALGISTGGPKTMQRILAQLPRNFPVPIVCTQHISPGFLNNHIEWLDRLSPLKVSVAQEGEKPAPGHVYYAPESCHLGVTAHKKFWYNPAPPLDHHRPSVTLMFEAIAQAYGARCLAIQMTGMGRDGAQGLLAIAEAGGITAAQNEASSVVFGMPKEAIALGAAQHILDLEEVPKFLWEWVIAPRLKAGHSSHPSN